MFEPPAAWSAAPQSARCCQPLRPLQGVQPVSSRYLQSRQAGLGRLILPGSFRAGRRQRRRCCNPWRRCGLPQHDRHAHDV